MVVVVVITVTTRSRGRWPSQASSWCCPHASQSGHASADAGQTLRRAAAPFELDGRWWLTAMPPARVANSANLYAARAREESQNCSSQLPQKSHQVRLLLFGEFQFLDEVEELDSVLQGQAAAVMEIGRAILDPPERESLDRTVPCFVLEEPLHMQVVHVVIKIERRRVAGRALGFAEEQLFPRQLARSRLFRVQVTRER